MMSPEPCPRNPELFANPVFAMFIIVTGDGIGAAEKCPSDTLCNAVIDSDRVVGHNDMACIGWHGVSLRGGYACKRDAFQYCSENHVWTIVSVRRSLSIPENRQLRKRHPRRA
jgi:hypothetical protein